LSVGTILRTDVNTLKTALVNANQGTTLLQIADGALSKVGEILQRQKALATQSNSGTLSDVEKGYLQQEFSKLTEELDRIVAETNFNGIGLINGNLSVSGGPETQAASAGTAVARDGESVSTSIIAGGAGGLTVATVGTNFNKIIGSLADISVGLADGTGTDLASMTVVINGRTFLSAADAVDLDDGDTNLVLTEVVASGETATVLNLDLADQNLGTAVTQAIANTAAQGIQTELAKLSIYATKAISKTDGDTGAIVDETSAAGTTNGTLLQGLDGDDFVLYSAEFDNDTGNAPSIGNFEVDYANGGATIRATINGQVYEKELSDLTGLKSASNGAANSIKLTGLDDTNSTFTISLAALDGDITIDSEQVAQNLEDALNSIFGSGSAGGVDFQVGTDADDTIGITLGDASSSALYVNDDGEAVDMDLVDGDDIETIQEALDNAINTVTSLRADAGALMSRFGYAASAIEVSIQNLDAARGQFLDADISAESTEFAKAQVLQQAAISVLAQANQIPQNLLKLIG